jgi:very-short-patch-repair endonuclease
MRRPRKLSVGEETLALQLRAEKITGWEREYRFASPRCWRFDFVFPRHRLAIEVDGGNRMVRRDKNGKPVVVGRHTGEKDAEKANTAALLGWRVLRYSPAQVRRGDAIAAILEALK